MDKKVLTKMCRYYHGENRCPSDNPNIQMFWEMERIFVNSDNNRKGEIELYKKYGGKDFPGVPTSLLNIIFTSWAKTTSGIKDELPQFYKIMDLYLDIPSDHFPKDKIPN